MRKTFFSARDDFICLKEDITAGVFKKPKRVIGPNSTEYVGTKYAGGGSLSLFFWVPFYCVFAGQMMKESSG